MDMYTRKTTSFSLKILIISVISSLIFWAVGEVLYSVLIKGVNSIVFIGIYFLVFGVFLFTGLFVALHMEGQKTEKAGLLLSLFMLLALVCLGIFFEFLYELGGKKAEEQGIASCIFAIDNSGSMESNDPNQERVSAIEEIIAGKESDFQYAVYSFGSEVKNVRPLGAVSMGMGELAIAPGGGTPICGVLDFIKEDIENGQLEMNGGIQVVLLTDGYATDTGFFNLKINSILRFYKKHGISISTVGLGDVDKGLLEKISDTTGGINTTTSKVEELSNAMKSVVKTDAQEAERNLLSVRGGMEKGWLYAILRILFITILGILFAGIKLGMVNNTESQTIILLFSFVGSAAAGIFMEIGMNLIGLPEFIVRLAGVLLIGLTPAYVVKQSSGGYGSGQSMYDSYDDLNSYVDSAGGMRVD